MLLTLWCLMGVWFVAFALRVRNIIPHDVSILVESATIIAAFLVVVFGHAPIVSQLLLAINTFLSIRDIKNWWNRRGKKLAAKLAGYKSKAIKAKLAENMN